MEVQLSILIVVSYRAVFSAITQRCVTTLKTAV